MRGVLRDGLPLGSLLVVGGLAVAGLLAAAALQGEPAVRGYAEFEAQRRGCSIVPRRSLNAVRCRYVSPNVYELMFSRDIGSSAPSATRGTCCPGLIAASLAGSRRVVVSLGEQETYPVRAQVLVP